MQGRNIAFSRDIKAELAGNSSPFVVPVMLKQHLLLYKKKSEEIRSGNNYFPGRKPSQKKNRIAKSSSSSENQFCKEESLQEDKEETNSHPVWLLTDSLAIDSLIVWLVTFLWG